MHKQDPITTTSTSIQARVGPTSEGLVHKHHGEPGIVVAGVMLVAHHKHLRLVHSNAAGKGRREGRGGGRGACEPGSSQPAPWTLLSTLQAPGPQDGYAAVGAGDQVGEGGRRLLFTKLGLLPPVAVPQRLCTPPRLPATNLLRLARWLVQELSVKSTSRLCRNLKWAAPDRLAAPACAAAAPAHKPVCGKGGGRVTVEPVCVKGGGRGSSGVQLS